MSQSNNTNVFLSKCSHKEILYERGEGEEFNFCELCGILMKGEKVNILKFNLY